MFRCILVIFRELLNNNKACVKQTTLKIVHKMSADITYV